MEIKDISNIRAGIGKIVVRLNKYNETIKINGEDYYLDPKYEPQDHVQVIGTIVAGKNKGQIAYMEYLSVLLALADSYDIAASYPDPRWFDHNGEKYIIIREEEVYLTIDKGVIKMQNGNLLIRPLTIEASTLIPEQESDKWAIVTNGSANGASEGDIVAYKGFKLRVEHPLHKTLFKDKYIINGKFLTAKLDKSLKTKVEKGLIK